MWASINKRCKRLLFIGGLLTALFHVVNSDEGHHWSYEGDTGPGHWPEMHEGCAGSRQSPINIEYTEAKYNSELSDIDFINDADENTVTYISNNGHTVVMETSALVLMNGAGLPDTYQVAQAHFHWGSDVTQGSEHRINEAAFPLELHVVTYNFEKHATVTDVLETGDQSGLAVFGVLFTMTAKNNTKLDPLLQHFDKIRTPGSDKAEVTGFHLWELLPASTRDYYRYNGSLTTPTCNEVVVWTIFEEKNTISEHQLEEFRKLLQDDSKPLVDNWRPVQQLNARRVEKSFKVPSYSVDSEDSNDFTGTASAPCISFALVIASILVASAASF